jgi:hypothetical protein
MCKCVEIKKRKIKSGNKDIRHEQKKVKMENNKVSSEQNKVGFNLFRWRDKENVFIFYLLLLEIYIWFLS